MPTPGSATPNVPTARSAHTIESRPAFAPPYRMVWLCGVVVGRTETGSPALATAAVHDAVFSPAFTALVPSGA